MKLRSEEDIDFGLWTATADRLGLVPYADPPAGAGLSQNGTVTGPIAERSWLGVGRAKP
jgi:hypothetical protein